jgi:predicted transcriptional regulator
MLGFPKGQCWALSCSLIYINNIVDDLDCNIKLFADDTSLYVIVDEQNYIQAADMLSTDLSHIHNWSQNRAIKFNHNKTESVLFTNEI